jgi:hypothetical protein
VRDVPLENVFRAVRVTGLPLVWRETICVLLLDAPVVVFFVVFVAAHAVSVRCLFAGCTLVAEQHGDRIVIAARVPRAASASAPTVVSSIQARMTRPIGRDDFGVGQPRHDPPTVVAHEARDPWTVPQRSIMLVFLIYHFAVVERARTLTRPEQEVGGTRRSALQVRDGEPALAWIV